MWYTYRDCPRCSCLLKFRMLKCSVKCPVKVGFVRQSHDVFQGVELMTKRSFDFHSRCVTPMPICETYTDRLPVLCGFASGCAVLLSASAIYPPLPTLFPLSISPLNNFISNGNLIPIGLPRVVTPRGIRALRRHPLGNFYPGS